VTGAGQPQMATQQTAGKFLKKQIMKTLILTKQELDSLPKEVQDQIMNVYNARSSEISELKSRIKSLPFMVVSYRSDHNTIEDTRNDEENLTFRIWEKTAGEEWGNNAGHEFQFRVGRKYIRMDISSWATNRSDYDCGSHYISVSKLSEILDLLEEAYSQDEEGEVEKDRLLSIACSRVENLMPSYY